MCTDFKIIIFKSKIKNRFYLPNNPKFKNDNFGNTEYFDAIDKTLIANK